LALVIIIALLAAKRFNSGRRAELSPSEKRVPLNLTAVSDSLIFECCRSFGLSAGVQTELGQEFSGITYRTFRQPWPAELPLIHFAERLSRLAAAREVRCDCLESTKNGTLECTLNAEGKTGAKVVVVASGQTKLVGREVVFICDKIESAPKKNIMRLLRAGYTFSYLVPPAYIPPNDLRKLLSRAGTIEIVSLPSDERAWASIAKTYARQSRTSKRGRKSSNTSEISRVFDSHPLSRSFCISPAGSSISQRMAKRIFQEAHRRDMTYLEFGQSDILKSLAESEGLRAANLPLNRELVEKTFLAFESELMRQMISPKGEWRQTIWVDCAKIEPDNMLALKISLDRLGIKIRARSSFSE
jgi:hypothetical protein